MVKNLEKMTLLQSVIKLSRGGIMAQSVRQVCNRFKPRWINAQGVPWNFVGFQNRAAARAGRFVRLSR